jgi:hypothetical protein
MTIGIIHLDSLFWFFRKSPTGANRRATSLAWSPGRLYWSTGCDWSGRLTEIEILLESKIILELKSVAVIFSDSF